jgi:hypothetical protein
MNRYDIAAHQFYGDHFKIASRLIEADVEQFILILIEFDNVKSVLDYIKDIIIIYVLLFEYFLAESMIRMFFMSTVYQRLVGW